MFEKMFEGLHRIKRRFAGNVDLARIPLVSTIRKQVIRFNRKKFVENVNGFAMHVDDNDTLALSWHHVFEPATTEFFKNNIRPGQRVIDIGANIGYFTLLFSKLVGLEGSVYAFEPEAENINLLRKNIEINSLKNVTIVEKAVDSIVTSRRLYINKINCGNHQIFDSGEDRESVIVQSTTLDDYFSNKEIKIDWIKMDIEGAEVQALLGMRKLIHQNPNLVLVTEIFVPGLVAAGSSVSEYVLALKELNFEFEEIDERLNKINPISSEELIRNFSPQRLVHPNIICRRPN